MMWKHQLVIRNAKYMNFIAPALDLENMCKFVGTNIIGVIGGNILNQAIYSIDCKANRLTIGKDVSKMRLYPVPITIKNNQIFVDVFINDTRLVGLLDSGAYRSSINSSILQKIHNKHIVSDEECEKLSSEGFSFKSPYIGRIIAFDNLLMGNIDISFLDFIIHENYSSSYDLIICVFLSNRPLIPVISDTLGAERRWLFNLSRFKA